MASRCPSVGFGITVLLLAGTGAAFADTTCYCRTATGEHVAVGGTACLKTSSGMREARCGFVLNNTSWNFTGKPCPQAGLDGGDGKIAELAVNPRR